MQVHGPYQAHQFAFSAMQAHGLLSQVPSPLQHALFAMQVPGQLLRQLVALYVGLGHIQALGHQAAVCALLARTLQYSLLHALRAMLVCTLVRDQAHASPAPRVHTHQCNLQHVLYVMQVHGVALLRLHAQLV